MVLLDSQRQFYVDPLTLAISGRFPAFGRICTPSTSRRLNSGRRAVAAIGKLPHCTSSLPAPHFNLHAYCHSWSQMSDLGTLGSQTGRQMLLKLVALFFFVGSEDGPSQHRILRGCSSARFMNQRVMDIGSE